MPFAKLVFHERDLLPLTIPEQLTTDFIPATGRSKSGVISKSHKGMLSKIKGVASDSVRF